MNCNYGCYRPYSKRYIIYERPRQCRPPLCYDCRPVPCPRPPCPPLRRPIPFCFQGFGFPCFNFFGRGLLGQYGNNMRSFGPYFGGYPNMYGQSGPYNQCNQNYYMNNPQQCYYNQNNYGPDSRY